VQSYYFIANPGNKTLSSFERICAINFVGLQWKNQEHGGDPDLIGKPDTDKDQG
jgi:hypothetical protein